MSKKSTGTSKNLNSCVKLWTAIDAGKTKDAMAQLTKCDMPTFKTLDSQKQQTIVAFHKMIYCDRLNFDSDKEKRAFCGKKETSYDDQLVIPTISDLGSGGGRTSGGT
jgi:hypothetical protein